MDQFAYLGWTTQWIRAALPALKQGGYFAAFIDWRNLPVMAQAIQTAGLNYQGICVWDKTQGVRPQKAAFRQRGEFILWGVKGRKNPNNKIIRAGVRTHANITRDKLHQTQKPIEIMRWLCSIVPEGALICDPFAGSGTTAIAALENKQSFIGCEFVTEIYNIAKQRLTQHTDGKDDN